MLKEINLLPAAYRPKPLINPWQALGIIVIMAYLGGIGFYIFDVNFRQMPLLNGEIEKYNQKLKHYQKSEEQYIKLNALQKAVQEKRNLVDSLRLKKEKAANILQEINSLKPATAGFLIGGCNFQEDGKITVTGTAANTAQVSEFINALNDVKRNKSFAQMNLAQIKNDNGILYFEINGKIKKGSG